MLKQITIVGMAALMIAITTTMAITGPAPILAFHDFNGNGGIGGASGNAVNGGNHIAGHDRACESVGAAANNPNCNGGTPPGVLRVKPVEGW
jgi:hypothetical protein